MSLPRGRPGRIAPVAVALVLLLAAALRFHALEAQSLWNDEGNSLRLAERGVRDLIDAAGRDIHPPGYYLLLKAWIAGAGTSEFALRAPSALQGLATVALAYALGRRLFAQAAGIIAALLVALSPLAVYYSQEARMYAQLALLATASMWIFVLGLDRARATPRRAWPWIVALGLCNAAGMYTQYAFAFTLAAQGIWLLAWATWRRFDAPARRALAGYAAAGLLALALFLPWLPTAWDQVTGWPRTGADLAPGEQLRTVLTWIAYGNTAGVLAPRWLAVPLILALLALIPLRPGSEWRASLPLAWGAAVVAGLFAAGAYREANLKFLMPAGVALALLAGGGVWRAWARPAPAIVSGGALGLLAVLVAGQVTALDALYNDPAYARDDYRAIAARIAAEARPDDAIILDAPNQREVFSYYYDGPVPVYELPRGLGGDDVATRAEARDVVARHRRIWAVFWGEEERDPRRVVQATLDAEAYPLRSTWYGDVRLAEYAALDAPPDAPQTTLAATFGDRMHLEGYALLPADAGPGDALGVTLFWRVDAPLDARYKVTVQLLSPEGVLLDQHDAEPGNDRYPTPTWTPGERVIDQHGLVVPPDAPPGTYPIIVGVYDAADPAARLPVRQGGEAPTDHLRLAELDIE